jgi:hypothetical protein
VLTEGGEFVGGIEALRRVALTLLSGPWSGHVEVYYASFEKLQRETDNLLKQRGLTSAQAETLERLRSRAVFIRQNIEVVRLTTRLTFLPVTGREPTWGVPMNTEEAIGFVTGTFVETLIGASVSNHPVHCQLYVPERTSSPMSTPILLSNAEVKDVQESWKSELRRHPLLSLFDWSTLIPVWHLRDTFIATRLLPAIAVRLAGDIVSNPPADLLGAWAQLRQMFPLSERDVLVPYDWCLALNSTRSVKDLAWLNSPPKTRSALYAQ